MKKLLYLTFLTFGFVFCYSQEIKVNGKILLENKDDRENVIEKTKVHLEQNGIKQISIVNENLEFEFNINGFDKILITFEPVGVGSVSGRFYTFKNNTLRKNDTISLKIPYALTCKFDKSVNNKTCPTCKKEDEVIPISYGLIAEITKKDEEKKEKKYKSGGCVTGDCDPNWYCKRDNLEF
ncbi:hypothetical protein [Psychroserpens algicola]|uniref:Uncharacterized protein n=1 Tax=Psychroserpens algicola TaxID=1719034 RepID=A0ABT0HE07_9FLAO|nr:hypothetical protein [Psychroserpens algicola]MCK8482289.1 hypothetical protein [Psychroserpens algicola]